MAPAASRGMAFGIYNGALGVGGLAADHHRAHRIAGRRGAWGRGRGLHGRGREKGEDHDRSAPDSVFAQCTL
jgi:hypothetical protein